NRSNLIVGLDIDLTKIPPHLQSEKKPLVAFASEVIEATADDVIAYKPNSAFFEAYGPAGLEQLQEIIALIPSTIPVILDAKRGDIGNTAKMYARAAFEQFQADAVTLAPYMGTDSLIPFCEYKDKYQFVLVLTSNPSAKEIEMVELRSKEPLYLQTARMVRKLSDAYGNCGAVVGATQPEHAGAVTDLLPDSLFLIPGIGTQGGSVEEILTAVSAKQRKNCLFNVSRDILYGSSQKDFATVAKSKAREYKEEINRVLSTLTN
ncbi:MAG: orotidine-5'-phosphate decarboxylase, partial [Candidatus Margulisiibacteriota bacterium]